MYMQEEFIHVTCSLARIDQVMTDEALMRRWFSQAIIFEPFDGRWRFDEGARWRLQLRGFGPLLQAEYVVAQRRSDLILWAYHGFWEGFDAWHWFPLANGEIAIQNRLEYELRLPGLDALWATTAVPLMARDAQIQMQRLKQVCEEGL